MDKITFGGLEVELTRRCNMGCKHCMRGNAQNKDIKYEDIDSFLDQVEMIDHLVLTGGEPLLNIDAMEHIAHALIERGIVLFGVMIVTNGSVYDERFISVLGLFKDIINISCKECFDDASYDPDSEKWRIRVGVSLDSYHENHEQCEANFLKYKKSLDGIAEVLRVLHGNAPIRMGKAEALAESVDLSYSLPYDAAQRVEVLDKEHTPICKVYDQFRLIEPNQKIVCCPLILNVDGFVRNSLCSDYSYDLIEKFPIICKACDSLWDAILAYGIGKRTCVENSHSRLKAGLDDEFTRSEAARLSEREKAPDAQDEKSSLDEALQWQTIKEAIEYGCESVEAVQDYLNHKRLQAVVKEFQMEPAELYKESNEWHHGSNPYCRLDTLTHCERCGAAILGENGKPKNSGVMAHTKDGQYVKCSLCNKITFVKYI